MSFYSKHSLARQGEHMRHYIFSLLLLCLAYLCISNLCGLQLDKMDLHNVFINNKTGAAVEINVHYKLPYPNQPAHNMTFFMSLKPNEIVFFDPKAHIAHPLPIPLVSISSAKDNHPLMFSLQKDNRHQTPIVTIETMEGAALKAINPPFVPPLVDFRRALNVDDNRYQEVLDGRLNYTRACAPRSTRELLDFFKSLYDTNKGAMLAPDQSPRIPKIVHHIWFGSKFPDQFRGWSERWIELHPEWEHILWTDQSTTQLPDFVQKYPQYKEIHISKFGPLQNQKLFDEAKNYGEKADIFRLEVLSRHGGVYRDIDFEPFEPFDILNHTYDFYAGILPLDTGLLTVNNGLIAAAPEHPIIRECMNMIESSKNHNRHQYFSIICATGPIPLTRAVWACANKDGKRDIVLPCTYFYPLAYRKGHLVKQDDVHPESFAVHYCTKTWARASAHQN